MTDSPPPLRRDRRVQAWVLAHGISAIGDRVWLIALAWSAIHVASPGVAGLVIGASAVPRVVLTLVGGAIADRADTRRILVLSNLARIAVLAVALVVVEAYGVSLWLLLGVAVAFGAADALNDPAFATMPRQMVRASDLGATSAMFQLAGRIAVFVGAPLGGVLIATGDLALPVAVDLVSFVVVGIAIATLLRPRWPLARQSSGSIVADLRAAGTYLRRDVNVRTLVVALSGLNLFVGPALAVGLALRVRHEHWGATWLGLFEAAVGVGAAAGALVAMRWKPDRAAFTGLVVLAVQGVAIVCTGFGDRTFVVASAGVIGVTAGLASSQLSGAFQATVDEAYLGRTASVLGLTDDALMPAAMAAFGLLAGLTSIQAAASTAGAAMIVLVLWSAGQPGIRTLRMTASEPSGAIAAG